MKPFASYILGKGKQAKMYHVCRNNDGFLELYRGTTDGLSEIDRIITTCTETDQLDVYMNPPKKKRKRYNPYKDDKQLKIE